MGYVESNLMRDERVVYQGHVHWFVFVPGVIFSLVGLLFLAASSGNGAAVLIGAVILLFGFYRLLSALLFKVTTELAVTTRRVIAKVGFISRNTVELNHSKVESFHVDQSITGRIFGFGTVVINGTGGGKTPIKMVSKPLDFRRQAMEVMDQGAASQPVQHAAASA